MKSAEAYVEEHLLKEILNGDLLPMTLLKPERELAESLGVSRPVVHKAIIRLEARGLVTIVPRKGVWVNDYRVSAKLGILESIYDLYHEGINRELNLSMLAFIRETLEAIIIQIIQGNASQKQACYDRQSKNTYEDGTAVFIWIHGFAISCGNPIYPMLINEFKRGIINVSDAVLFNGDAQVFLKRLTDINRLIIDNEVTREGVRNALHALFKYIERQWLIEKKEASL